MIVAEFRMLNSHSGSSLGLADLSPLPPTSEAVLLQLSAASAWRGDGKDGKETSRGPSPALHDSDRS